MKKARFSEQQIIEILKLAEAGNEGCGLVVRRYAHLAADHLAPFSERLGALRAVEDEIVHKKVTGLKNEGLALLQAIDFLVAGGLQPNPFTNQIMHKSKPAICAFEGDRFRSRLCENAVMP